VLRDGSGNCYCAACWANQILAAATPGAAPAAAPAPPPAIDLFAPAPSQAPAQLPTLPPRVQTPAGAPARIFTCVFCQIKVREPDVRFFHGEVACPACHFKKSADEQSPMETCTQCGAVVAADLLVPHKGGKLCADCAEERRIASNQKNREMRTMLQAGRVATGDGSASRRGPLWASIIGGALVIIILSVVAYFVVNGLSGPGRIPTYTVIDPDGNQVELRQAEARQRLQGNPELTLYKDGERLPRAEALKLLGD
jgi:hypothetical protein